MIAVTTAKGPAWDDEQAIREQAGFDQHAAFMDHLVEQGVIVLGGPIDGGDDDDIALVAVDVETVAEAEAVFAADPWIGNGVFRLKTFQAWTIWLDGRGWQQPR